MADHALTQCLYTCGISRDHYDVVIAALSQIASLSYLQEPEQEAIRKDQVSASIRRRFNGVEILVENREMAYAVWIINLDKAACCNKILFFGEFPWGQES